jgi:hypothetical protein
MHLRKRDLIEKPIRARLVGYVFRAFGKQDRLIKGVAEPFLAVNCLSSAGLKSVIFFSLRGMHRLMQPWPSPRAGCASRKGESAGVWCGAGEAEPRPADCSCEGADGAAP